MSKVLGPPLLRCLVAVVSVLSFLAFTAPHASAAPANGYGFGLADNVASDAFFLGTNRETYFNRMAPKVYRVQIPYDILNASTVEPERTRRMQRFNEIKDRIIWARAHGVEKVLVTFVMGWKDGPPDNPHKYFSTGAYVPTDTEYNTQVRKVINSLVGLVDEWSPANEPNGGWQWLGGAHDARGPARLAAWSKKLEASVAELAPSYDEIISPEFHDRPIGDVDTSSEIPGESRMQHWIRHYSSAGGRFGQHAALHPYNAAAAGYYEESLSDFAEVIPSHTDVWLTEIGIRVPEHGNPPPSAEALTVQANGVAKLASVVRSGRLRDGDFRLNRAYYYNLWDDQSTPDYGLVNNDVAGNGLARDSWVIWCTWANGENATLCPKKTDFIPPVLTVTSPTQNAVLNKNSVRAEFQANETATFRCSWDNGAATDCGSPTGQIDLADGAHSLTVTATDVQENAATTIVNFTVNNTSPPPEAKTMLVRNHAASWNVMHGGENIPLAGGSWSQTCGNGYAAAVDLQDANGFRFCVRSDLADRRFFLGNVVNHAGNYYHVMQGQLESFGGAGWNYCPAGSQFVGREYHLNGYWLCMAAANDPDPEARTMTVRADVPSSYASYRGVNYHTGGGSWGDQCKAGTQDYGRVLDQNGFRLCVRTDLANRNFYVGNVVSDGGNYYKLFKGYVTNLGVASWGYCSPGSSSIGVTHHSNGFFVCMDDNPLPPDTTAPTLQILTPTAGAQISTSTVNATFQANEPATFRCKLDSGSFETCQSPWSRSNVPNGSHVLSVEATDLAGNISVSSGTFTVSIPSGPQAKIAIVRSNAASAYLLQSGAVTYIGGWGWGTPCEAGMQPFGQIFDSNGFALCVRNDLASRKFYVGNIVNNGGGYYKVFQGTVTYLGGASWGYCPPGASLIGQSFHSNGFLVCMDNTG